MKSFKKKWDKFLLWIASYAFAWGVVVTRSFFRMRMSHDNGITARGRVKITSNPKFPAHSFLKPGKEFLCRLRHASVSYADDAVTQVRAASIKFADSFFESPLDLELNTGTISLFWTARNFIEFASYKHMTNGLAFSEFYDKYPTGLEAAKDGLRHHPSSYAQMYYHSQVAQRFVGEDGIERYVKFRLIPEDRGPETGLIPRHELKNRWSELSSIEEPRTQNYLKQEFSERISKKKICYFLQLQLHTPQQGDDPEILNCNVAWDEATHPFFDVAVVELNELLSLDENNLMRFGVSNCPASLGVLPADSLDDYNSINYMRSKIGVAKVLRLWAYRIFGMPKPVPDWRPGQTFPSKNQPDRKVG